MCSESSCYRLWGDTHSLLVEAVQVHDIIVESGNLFSAGAVDLIPASLSLSLHIRYSAPPVRYLLALRLALVAHSIPSVWKQLNRSPLLSTLYSL